MEYTAQRTTRRGGGWVAFAGIMLTLAGLLDIVNGLWALGAEDTRIDAVFFDNDLNAWGWFYIILGIVLVVTGFGVFQRAEWARDIGIAFAVIAAVLNMLWVFRYPIASLILVLLSVLVIYGLTVYGTDTE